MKFGIEEIGLLERLISKVIYGFNASYPEIIDDNNTSIFEFDADTSKFEYCNPGLLLLTYYSDTDEYLALGFKAENFIIDETIQIPKLVLIEKKSKSNFYNSYRICKKVIRINIYSANYINFDNDELILFTFSDDSQLLIELTNSINGSINLYFNKKFIKEKIENELHNNVKYKMKLEIN